MSSKIISRSVLLLKLKKLSWNQTKIKTKFRARLKSEKLAS